MKIDKEEHRTFLLEALSILSIPAAAADLYIEVREAVKNAEVAAGKDAAPSYDSLVP